MDFFNNNGRELQGEPVWDPGRPGDGLLEALRQEIPTKGVPDAERIRQIADEYDTTAAKVCGVIGYYSDLAKDATSVKVCMGEACRFRGSAGVLAAARSKKKINVI